MTEEQNVESVEEQSAVPSPVDGAYPGWVMISRLVKKRKRYGGRRSPMPNITSLLDALFIILVFLLKSYSTNPVSGYPEFELEVGCVGSSVEPRRTPAGDHRQRVSPSMVSRR